jgi:hypothetical protein
MKYGNMSGNRSVWRSRRSWALLVLLVGCDSTPTDVSAGPPFTITHEGLAGTTVVQLHALSHALLAVTNDGLHVKEHGGSQWSAAGLAGFDIMHSVVFSDEHFLVSTYEWHESERRFVRFRTLNGGRDWQPVADGFGTEQRRDPIGAMHFDPATQSLYAAGPSALARSRDHGLTWELLDGFFGGFGTPMTAMRLNTATNELWYGGQNPIEQGLLFRYSLATAARVVFAGLLPAPSTYFGIRFDPSRPDFVYAAGEGGIAYTADRGASWSRPLGDVDYRFYFDVLLDPADPAHLYTAGWTKTDVPQPLILEWSTDRGQSWERYQYPGPTHLFGGVRSMIAVREQQQTVLYLGLYGGGVVRAVPRR